MMQHRLSHKNNGVPAYGRNHGFTLFELMVVILLLCGIYYVLIERLMYFRAQYESAEVRWTLSAIHTSRQAARAGGRGAAAAVVHPDERNPMHMLSRLPHNYLGELCDPDLRQVERGNWYFDRCNSWLVYVYNSEKFFAPEYPKILKFNVESLRLLTGPARSP